MRKRHGDPVLARTTTSSTPAPRPANPTAGRLDLPPEDIGRSRLYRPDGWGAPRKRSLWQRLTGT